jgi:uncharacterized protein (TIGR02145 family)
MKAIISFQKRTHWFLALVTLIPWLLFLVLPSCQKDEFEKDSMRNMPSMSCTGLPINGKPILYYGPETFKITSKAPVKETRTLSNQNFDSFDGNFVLKVQNGSNNKIKVEKIEIRIDDILIVSSSDFRKRGKNIISKPITLSANSTLEIKMKGDKRSFIVLWIEGTLKEEMTVTDVEGNVYKTVTIGTQVWMAENLKTTKFNDGTNIPLVTENMLWSNLPTPAYCWFNNEITNKDKYGALYNWYTVNTGILCPVSYHVPTDWEMGGILTEYLGGWLTAGGKLKETGLTHWLSPNEGATNESGFTALPGGRRNEDGSFVDIGLIGHWWSATELNETNAYQLYVYYLTPNFANFFNFKVVGYSIRCLKD